MKLVGAKDVRLDRDTGFVLGWIGTNVNVARFAEYQLLVTALEVPDRTTVLSCSARPRVRLGLAGRDRSTDHVDRLANEIGSARE